MRSSFRSLAFAIAALALLASSASALARHEQTHKGTVVSSTGNKITVTVVNDKTKKTQNLVFEFDRETKFLRGDRVVTAAEAKIQKGEKIAVTVNHDDAEDLALVIRLDEKK